MDTAGPICFAWLSTLVICDRQTNLAADQLASKKVCSAPVGGGNLLHQLKTGAMGGPTVFLQGLVKIGLKPFGRGAALHPEGQQIALCPGSQTDGIAGGIVAHAVGEQIVHRLSLIHI